jgi:SsrA-binding protein
MAQGKILANNKKARHDYFIEDVYEAGIALTGTEIKSMRAGKVNLKDSYAKVVDNEMFVFNMHVSPYDQGSRYNVDPMRPRKLLLHRQEIRKLLGAITLKGLTIVPLNVYLNKNGVAKLEIAVAKGKKEYDKRDTLAKKDADRKIAHQMKDSGRD